MLSHAAGVLASGPGDLAVTELFCLQCVAYSLHQLRLRCYESLALCAATSAHYLCLVGIVDFVLGVRAADSTVHPDVASDVRML